MTEEGTAMADLDTATFAGGCFWCTEAVFQRLRGVKAVVSGYTGGETDDPTYYEVCSGETGHAEAVRVTFDPAVISYEQLVEVFFHTHDPTTPNQQGADFGTQYRSAIFYENESQRETAERAKRRVDESGLYPRPAVTEIVPLGKFYTAEDYHQDFYNQNETYPYCQIVIDPKLTKLYKEFGGLAV
jgi:peptide-methionine (S)-S-oxide reductase